MADEAPAENAPAAEGAGMNDVYTTPNGYQKYETLAMKSKHGGVVGITGTVFCRKRFASWNILGNY